MRLRQVATEIYVDNAIREYIVRARRGDPPQREDHGRLLHAWRFGTDPDAPVSGPRPMACLRGARDDVKDLAVAVLAHRITLTPEATFDGATPESLIAQVLEDVPSPTIGS